MSTFLGVPQTAPERAQAGQIVIMSAAHCTPYEQGKPSHSADGPAAIRAASAKFQNWHSHFDFDTGNVLLPADGQLVDGGEISTLPDAPEANRDAIASAVRHVVGAGAFPIVIGGDDSVPIPVFQASEALGPLWIVQVDAHIDWRAERFGEPLGWSSTMRRASELDWVKGIVQVGIRGVGSALPDDVAFARQWGAKIVTARDVFASGMSSAVSHVPDGANVYVTLDCDALDPSEMPAVMAQSPGGLAYRQIIDLFEDLGSRCRVVGFNIVELAPQRDVGQVSALTSGRLICLAANAIRGVR